MSSFLSTDSPQRQTLEFVDGILQSVNGCLVVARQLHSIQSGGSLDQTINQTTMTWIKVFDRQPAAANWHNAIIEVYGGPEKGRAYITNCGFEDWKKWTHWRRIPISRVSNPPVDPHIVSDRLAFSDWHSSTPSSLRDFTYGAEGCAFCAGRESLREEIRGAMGHTRGPGTPFGSVILHFLEQGNGQLHTVDALRRVDSLLS